MQQLLFYLLFILYAFDRFFIRTETVEISLKREISFVYSNQKKKKKKTILIKNRN